MVPPAFNDAVVGAWTCGITAVLTTLLVAPAFVPPRASATVWLVWVCVVATVIAPVVLCAYAVASFNTTTASTAASPPAGYWGHDDAPWWHGTPGNHDFCEEVRRRTIRSYYHSVSCTYLTIVLTSTPPLLQNYAYSPFIAEFHNVWSSLPVIAYGSIGTWYTRRFATQEVYGVQFVVCNECGMVVCGVCGVCGVMNARCFRRFATQEVYGVQFVVCNECGMVWCVWCDECAVLAY